ncbi:unnamed protein product [Candidula unifasciata]|uniref:LicD/FKTN/FKRP nucleotidyltransferase domain-containing protein n=1 Tax=Candidula unifasciata TaxID=100452 RepID=A0A8S3YV27_9EUPU|nr:unnamed protein product [Candidula unifasciata]
MRISCLVERMASRLALRMSRKVVMVLLLCFLMSLYAMFSMINNHYQSHNHWYKRPAPCVTPKSVMDEMVVLTSAVSNVLNRLNVSHALCYGTLWGALRYGKTLPWDTNVDFCVLKTEINKVPWDRLQGMFKANHMGMVYDMRHGEYLITRGPAVAVLTVFDETNSGEARRDGVVYRLLRFYQNNPESFPSRLLKAPLSKIVFHGQPMPIPNEDDAILKYFYPDNWWLEKPPPGCPTGKFAAA